MDEVKLLLARMTTVIEDHEKEDRTAFKVFDSWRYWISGAMAVIIVLGGSAWAIAQSIVIDELKAIRIEQRTVASNLKAKIP